MILQQKNFYNFFYKKAGKYEKTVIFHFRQPVKRLLPLCGPAFAIGVY